jgi:hypothetical protein
MGREHSHAGGDGPATRPQTAQDFVIGLGVFPLAVTFVFGFFPQVMQP